MKCGIAGSIMALLMVLLGGCAQSSVTNVAFSPGQQDVLALEYVAFDQTMGEGWRAWAARGEHAEAARMLDHYAATHENLTRSELRIIRFHAGQMYGHTGNSEKAVSQFRKSINPDEPVDASFKWNAYVRGTIAFLERDLATLQVCRDELATQEPRTRTMPDGQVVSRVPNLDVLNRFISHFDRTYREAYSSQLDGDR